jgi:hypothetical protein
VGVPVLVCHAARRIRAVWPRNFISTVKTSEIAIARRDSHRQKGITHPFLREDGRWWWSPESGKGEVSLLDKPEGGRGVFIG